MAEKRKGWKFDFRQMRNLIIQIGTLILLTLLYAKQIKKEFLEFLEPADAPPTILQQSKNP